MAIRMNQVPGLLNGLGDAYDDYAGCRTRHPSQSTRGVLTPVDPCYTDLRRWRESEGRDPSGLDLWGSTGGPAPPKTPQRDPGPAPRPMPQPYAYPPGPDPYRPMAASIEPGEMRVKIDHAPAKHGGYLINGVAE